MKTLIPAEDGDVRAAVQLFLRMLLEQNVVDAVIVPMRTPHGAVTPAVVADPSLLSSADPLAPVMPSNAATLVGKLSVREPRARVGAVMRACEMRALVELVKLKQASLDDLTLIAVDCVGTFDVPEYYDLQEAHEPEGDLAWVEQALSDLEAVDSGLRLACQMCEQPTFDQVEFSIEYIGGDLSEGIYVSLPDDVGSAMGLAHVETGSTRADALRALVAVREKTRDSEFESMRLRLQDDSGLIGVFDQCIRCHNCMTVCPICYCKTCVFKSNVFDHEPMQYIGWANHKGAFRLPADTSLFHLTRLNHMVLSCVGCGMCTQACPASLPVGVVFRTIGQRLQQVFEYAPGRSVDEVLPLITFEENEWADVGE